MKLINFNFYRINKIKNKKIVINYINSLRGCKSCADYLWVAATFSNSAYQSAPNFRMRASFTNL